MDIHNLNIDKHDYTLAIHNAIMDAYKWNYGHPQIIMDIHIYRVYSLVFFLFCFIFLLWKYTSYEHFIYVLEFIYCSYHRGSGGGIFLQFDIYPGNNYCDNVSLLFAVKLA